MWTELYIAPGRGLGRNSVTSSSILGLLYRTRIEKGVTVHIKERIWFDGSCPVVRFGSLGGTDESVCLDGLEIIDQSIGDDRGESIHIHMQLFGTLVNSQVIEMYF